MKIPAMMSLLLVSVGLRDGVQVQSYSISQLDIFSQEIPLDMAPASFDDQYAGCLADMTAALPDLNRSEFQANRDYADGWAMANNQWQERRTWGSVWGSLPPSPPGFRDEHGVALLAYTANSPLHKKFNAAVREAGRSRAHYLHHFPFKTLHFLLTEALQLLRSHRSRGCQQVYRGVHGLRFRPAGPGATVRLGGFASASLKNVAAQQFGEDTFFGIWTCLGAPIRGYSFFPEEEEVLIPPFETFQVINTSRPTQGPARIYLRALGKRSTYNCEYIKEKKCRSGPCWLDSSAPGSLSASWSLLLLLLFLLLRALPENPGLQHPTRC
ncbi:GPI-linked NAD(P)(+)--arginine ADP-ribosyltransferase 1 isoform X1 [Apodemus sylvaticus]|uniref:GPI-linked NAD(P)(+)--arginine ADP-ribosyltransferase 1 isoform X1 n=1 Tax=Apodemus sylvaticus TaxID=10129 RepID=UPI0022429BB0|nr:GPI-linked NAD(P)(+)--arginine ADP-ribosyltransferase 1 isoform X1 [Apodemus sylvaticus]